MRLTAPLALARIALGSVFLVRTTALANLPPLARAFPLAAVHGPLLGWPEPGWHFAWDGFVLPDGIRMVACVVRTVAALLFTFGIRTRVAGLVAGACGFVALSQDPFGFVFTLHTLFLGTMMVALADAKDARVVRLFVASVYAWSALAKVQAEWLSGDTLRALAEDGLLAGPAAALLLGHPALRVAASWATFAGEALLPALLLIGRTRRFALGFACIIHLSFELGARPDVMGLVMASLLVTFLAPRPSTRAPGGVAFAACTTNFSAR